MSKGRYSGCAKLTRRDARGRAVSYLAPRILPQGDTVADGTTTVGASEIYRLDLVAWRTLQNVSLSWQICDANDAMDPFDLVDRAGAEIQLPGSSL